jgi:hypothetical protein
MTSTPAIIASSTARRDAAGVHDRVLARVVEVEAVGERRVRQHGVGGGDARAATEQRTLRRAAQALGHVQRRAAEILADRREAVAERVQREQRRLADGRLRDRVERELRDEAREALRRRHSRSSLAMTMRWIWLVPS